jgi:hypothetical protein
LLVLLFAALGLLFLRNDNYDISNIDFAKWPQFVSSAEDDFLQVSTLTITESVGTVQVQNETGPAGWAHHERCTSCANSHDRQHVVCAGGRSRALQALGRGQG